MWLNLNFLLVEEFEITESLYVSFISLRDGKPLILEMDGISCQFTIRTDNIDLAGDIVQSLVSDYLKVEELSSNADFPLEVEHLKKYISRVEELQSVRQQLAAEIADNSSAIRALVVRAEDARIIGEMYDNY
jgi:Bardet-Biedl syndrome 2 protein